MDILDPVLGGKIRATLTTLFAVFVLAQEIWSSLPEQSWVGNVTKVYAFAIGAIQILTHGTDVGGPKSF